MADLLEVGRERIRMAREAPGMADQIIKLQAQLAECRSQMFNTPQVRDLQRRCCDACNENRDLRKLVDELKAENADLRRQLGAADSAGGGYPPPDVSRFEDMQGD